MHMYSSFLFVKVRLIEIYAMIRISENRFSCDDEFLDCYQELKMHETKLPTFVMDYLYDIKSNL